MVTVKLHTFTFSLFKHHCWNKSLGLRYLSKSLVFWIWIFNWTSFNTLLCLSKVLPPDQTSIKDTLSNEVVSAQFASDCQLSVKCSLQLSRAIHMHYYRIIGPFLKTHLKNARPACLAAACFLPTLIMPCRVEDYA